MLRMNLNDALKQATLTKDTRAVSTIRLIIAALKDRDVAARSQGNAEGISEAGILQMLQAMVQQRQESITLYEQSGRLALARQEQEEIAVIERFLPGQLSEREMAVAIDAIIGDLGAQGLKDIGRVMTTLRTRYAGRMDFARASVQVKERLSS